jgi:hypothetical protein
MGLSQDATSLYWGNEQGDTVLGLTKSSGALRQIASGQSSPSATASDGVNVYWIDSSGTALYSAPAAGGGAVQTYFAGNLESTTALALTPNHGAMALADTNSVFVTSLPPAGSPTLISGMGSSWLVVDMANAYILDSGGDVDQVSLACDTTSGGIATVGGSLAGLALFSGTLYVGKGPQILSLPTTGPTAEPFSTDPSGGITGIFADASGVYWTNEAGTVSKAPLAGGTPTVLATTQSNPAFPLADATAIYWIDVSAGTIMGLAK